MISISTVERRFCVDVAMGDVHLDVARISLVTGATLGEPHVASIAGTPVWITAETVRHAVAMRPGALPGTVATVPVEDSAPTPAWITGRAEIGRGHINGSELLRSHTRQIAVTRALI